MGKALPSELLVLSDEAVAAPAVVFRAKNRSPDIRRSLATQAREHTGCLILASMIDPIADGVHLSSSDEYPPQYQGIVGRSCHSLDEVRRAEQEGADYVTVSPVFETESKPGYGPPLGLAGLAQIVEESEIPVYALGGVQLGRVAGCRRAGVAGIAVQGAVARSKDPVATISALLSEWRGQ